MAIKLQLTSARALKSRPKPVVGDKVKIEPKDDSVELKVHLHDKLESYPARYPGHKEDIASGSPSPKIPSEIDVASPTVAHTEMKEDTAKPNTFMVDDHDERDEKFSGFEKLFNCLGADFADDDSPSYMSCSTQSTNTKILDEELRKLQKEKEGAIVCKEKKRDLIEALKVERTEAVEKEKKLREIAQAKEEKEAAIARQKQKKAALQAEKAAAEKAKRLHAKAQKVADARARQQNARNANYALYMQAVKEADKAKEVAEIKDEKAAEVRRQMEKAKVAVRTTKMEAKWAKKILVKEVKQCNRALKELRVVTKEANAARQNFSTYKAAAAKRIAKTEAKKAVVARKLAHKMEEEKKQIKNAEDNIRNLREKITATYGMKSIIPVDSDFDTVLTVSTIDTEIFPDPYLDDAPFDLADMNQENVGTVLSDLIEEASILLTPEK